MYQIPCASLGDLAGSDPTTRRLTLRGVEQPILVPAGGGDPACDHVEFYGEARERVSVKSATATFDAP